MSKLSYYFIPLLIAVIIISGLVKKEKVFELFTLGASEGVKTSLKIIPSLVGLIVAVSMLRASGTIEILNTLLKPLVSLIGFPKEVLPMAIFRPISGSASLAFLSDIFKECGPDSFAGRVASVISGSTETTFYTLTLYFSAVKAKDTRHTLKSALIADFVGIFGASFLVGLFIR